MNVFPIVFCGVLLGVAPQLAAQGRADDEARTPAPLESAGEAAMTDGEVRKIDKAAGKITLRHGLIANLDMPQMTMVFRVDDPAVLDQVRVGDKVRFAAEKVAGQYTLTKLVLAR
jgi:Cu/Ag efflux protein CusF